MPAGGSRRRRRKPPAGKTVRGPFADSAAASGRSAKRRSTSSTVPPPARVSHRPASTNAQTNALTGLPGSPKIAVVRVPRFVAPPSETNPASRVSVAKTNGLPGLTASLETWNAAPSSPQHARHIVTLAHAHPAGDEHGVGGGVEPVAQRVAGRVPSRRRRGRRRPRRRPSPTAATVASACWRCGFARRPASRGPARSRRLSRARRTAGARKTGTLKTADGGERGDVVRPEDRAARRSKTLPRRPVAAAAGDEPVRLGNDVDAHAVFAELLGALDRHDARRFPPPLPAAARRS